MGKAANRGRFIAQSMLNRIKNVPSNLKSQPSGMSGGKTGTVSQNAPVAPVAPVAKPALALPAGMTSRMSEALSKMRFKGGGSVTARGQGAVMKKRPTKNC